jgi:biopolymer transport protein ExbD
MTDGAATAAHAEIALSPTPRRRRPGLTPMIDIVFLLLVFFMLAARFGTEAETIPLAPAGGGGEAEEEAPAYEGAPRLVDVGPDFVRLNGVRLGEEEIAAALAPLMPSAEAVVVMRAVEGAPVQRTVDMLDRLGAAGIRRVVLAE